MATNHMSEVAKILGVELGERFKIDFCDKIGVDKYYDYYISNNGVNIDEVGRACISSDALFNLITGEWIIKKKPWKPKNNEVYYYVNASGTVDCEEWLSFCEDITWYKLGNCYRTKEEAEANKDKWFAFYNSDDVLEV